MAETPEERARFEAWHASLEVDDEPLDDDDLAALAEPWDPATSISLDEYIASRAAREAARGAGDGPDRAEV